AVGVPPVVLRRALELESRIGEAPCPEQRATQAIAPLDALGLAGCCALEVRDRFGVTALRFEQGAELALVVRRVDRAELPLERAVAPRVDRARREPGDSRTDDHRRQHEADERDAEQSPQAGNPPQDLQRDEDHGEISDQAQQGPEVYGVRAGRAMPILSGSLMWSPSPANAVRLEMLRALGD